MHFSSDRQSIAPGSQHDTDVASAYERDETYYWPDVVQFLVERTEFCVPRHAFIVGSEHFAEKYGLRELARERVNIVDITAVQFKSFLQVLFPAHINPTISKGEWLDVIHLATLWEFHELRKLAIEHLEGQLTDTEMILVGRAAYAVRWLINGFTAFVARSGIITEEEADIIGLRTANRLWIAKAMIAGRTWGEMSEAERGLVVEQLYTSCGDEIGPVNVEEARRLTKVEKELHLKEKEARRLSRAAQDAERIMSGEENVLLESPTESEEPSPTEGGGIPKDIESIMTEAEALRQALEDEKTKLIKAQEEVKWLEKNIQASKNSGTLRSKLRQRRVDEGAKSVHGEHMNA